MAIVSMMATSCSISIKKSDGNATQITKDWEIGDFSALKISCGGDVIYTVSDSVSVRVEASDSKMQDLSIITDSNGTLSITTQDSNKGIHINFNDSESYKIYISGPALTSVTVAGSADFQCDDEINVANFTAVVTGSGDIEMARLKAMEATLSVTGSGDIDIKDIVSERFNASISGSGDIEVNATVADSSNMSIIGSGTIDMQCRDCGTVNAVISGSGTIDLKGNAKALNKNISGSGVINASALSVNK